MAIDASLASDNIYRGVSLNAGDPAAALNLTWDGASGWYAGGMASEARFYGHANSSAQITADAGYARSTESGWGWEFGATATAFPEFVNYDYAEAFAGLLGERWNARLYFSPDYFGRGERTLYAEFNYTYPLDDRLRLFAHTGALQGLSGGRGNTRRYDMAVGAGAHLGAFDLQVRWIDTSRVEYLYPVMAADTRHEWVASLTFSY